MVSPEPETAETVPVEEFKFNDTVSVTVPPYPEAEPEEVLPLIITI